MDRCGLTVPPTSSSKHRATTCAKTDIEYLTDLVLPASLGSLRHRDKLLFDLLQRTLNLQSDDIHHNEDSRLKFYPTAQDEKADRRFAHQMLVQHRRVATTTGERRSIVNTASTLGRSEAKLSWIRQLLLFLLTHSALSPRLAPIMAR